MGKENIDEIMAGIDKLLADCDEFDKEFKFQQEQIEFLINEWKTNKHYFAPNDDDYHEVTVEDVIKSVFYFAWGSKGNYDHMNK